MKGCPVRSHHPSRSPVPHHRPLTALATAEGWLAAGGIVLAFAIMRYAGYLYSVRSGKILDEDYRTLEGQLPYAWWLNFGWPRSLPNCEVVH